MLKKFVLAMIIIFIVVVIIVICWLGTQKGNSNYSGLTFTDTSIQGDLFKTTVFQTASGKSFRKYNYHIKDNCLHITIYSGIVTKLHSSGVLQIEIRESVMSEIEKVYLEDGNNTKLIYQANVKE